MKLGFVGLGRMGGNMVKRLLRGGHIIVAFAPSKDSREEAERNGALVVGSLDELVEGIESPRVVWLMVPSGKATEDVIGSLIPLLDKGDILIDGGNSYYKDSIKRAELLKSNGISFLDAGTSGGIWGLKEGYCLMVGGEEDAFARVEPCLKTLAPENGYARVGPSGSGHYVKMVHNAIEYGLLQAYGEGFELMNAKKEFDLDLEKIAELWSHGSVVRSWLLELAVNVFREDPSLESIKGYVEDTGEGRWSVMEGIEESVPLPVITLSLLQRFRSRQESSFSAKVIAALRGQFGGHEVKKNRGK